ncbi:MAG: hypothetical protein ISS11_07335 [Candidatus Marinimicrobia bacterium]|nr:hypothetical protein [Candidatus Neomarinimicrobiota bacterium]
MLINKTWKNFPKLIKWIISTIIAAIIGYLIIQFLRGENYSILNDNLSNILILIIVFIGIGIIIAMYKIMRDQEKVINNNRFSNPRKNLKDMLDNFELETIQKDNYEWTFKVGRFHSPKSNPDVDEFIEDIKMSKTRCVKCKSEIKKDVTTGFYNRKERYAQCPKQDCELYETLINDYELENIVEQEKINFKSKVRLDFKKYWKIYCKEYDRLTKGKYDDFEKPLTARWGR